MRLELSKLRPESSQMRLEWLLRVAVAGAFIGHGAYGAVLAKASWFSYFAVFGISEATVTASELMTIVGVAEIALGVLVLVIPVPQLLVFMATWKIVTELLRPAAGEPVWEFVERASNMVAPLALLAVRRRDPLMLSRRLLPCCASIFSSAPAFARSTARRRINSVSAACV